MYIRYLDLCYIAPNVHVCIIKSLLFCYSVILLPDDDDSQKVSIMSVICLSASTHNLLYNMLYTSAGIQFFIA